MMPEKQFLVTEFVGKLCFLSEAHADRPVEKVSPPVAPDPFNLALLSPRT